jgi:hypothetical protein
VSSLCRLERFEQDVRKRRLRQRGSIVKSSSDKIGCQKSSGGLLQQVRNTITHDFLVWFNALRKRVTLREFFALEKRVLLQILSQLNPSIQKQVRTIPAKTLTRRTVISDWYYRKDITKRRVVHEMMSFIAGPRLRGCTPTRLVGSHVVVGNCAPRRIHNSRFLLGGELVQVA